MRVFFLPFKLTKEFAKNKTSCYVSSQQAIEALYPSPEGKGFTANRDKEGKTPLHVAATWDKKLIAEILLEAGADVHFKDKEGKTPLDIAKNRKVFRVLWSFGAS